MGNSLESTSHQRQRSHSGSGARSRAVNAARRFSRPTPARPSTGRAQWSTRSSQSNKLAYAITTGVGKLSDVRIAGDQIRELQVNLVRSHAAGVGEPLSVAETRAMMLLRANSLSKGYLGRARRGHRHALRNAQPRRHSVRAVAGQRGRERRSGSAGASGAGADRRRRMHRRQRHPHSQRRSAEAGADQAAGAGGKRSRLADQRTQGMLAVGTLALLAAETLVDSADVIGGLAATRCKAPTRPSTSAFTKRARIAAR